MLGDEDVRNEMEVHEIIMLKKQGVSNREIARITKFDRKTISKYWNNYQRELENLSIATVDIRSIQESLIEPPKYDSSNRGKRKYNSQIDKLLDEILEGEKKKAIELGNRHKQKLSCVQIHELIVDAGHDIGLTTITGQVRLKREKIAEGFIKQDYEYGDRLEYDFGEVKLIINDVKERLYIAVLSSPASNYRYAYLYRSQDKSVFIDSHVRFFEQLKGVYKEVVYDNMRNVVSKFIGKNEKELNSDLIKMSMYYGFNINVTNCFKGNEKGHVENSVKFLRNKLFAVKYKFSSIEEAERYMYEKLKKINITSNIDQEIKQLNSYRPPLEIADIATHHVNSYSFIQVDNNFYSVPEYLIGKTVTVKKYLRNIRIYSNNEFVCEYKRIDGNRKYSVNILHYLVTLRKKPGAIKNSLALKQEPKLSTIYHNHFKTNPIKFIDILRENSNKSIIEIISVLNEHIDGKQYYQIDSKPKESKLEDQTRRNISQINEIIIGGINHVN